MKKVVQFLFLHGSSPSPMADTENPMETQKADNTGGKALSVRLFFPLFSQGAAPETQAVLPNKPLKIR